VSDLWTDLSDRPTSRFSERRLAPEINLNTDDTSERRPEQHMMKTRRKRKWRKRKKRRRRRTHLLQLLHAQRVH